MDGAAEEHPQLSMARQTYVGVGSQELAQSPADIIQGAVNARQAALGVLRPRPRRYPDRHSEDIP